MNHLKTIPTTLEADSPVSTQLEPGCVNSLHRSCAEHFHLQQFASQILIVGQ
jgi:hypothetical protein